MNPTLKSTMTPGRRDAVRDLLVTQVAATATFPEPRSPSARISVRPARYRFAVPLTIAAATVAAVTTILIGNSSPTAPQKNPPPQAQADITARLDRISAIAAVQPALTPGKDQYIYTRSLTAGAELKVAADGTLGTYGPLPALVRREAWAAQDPTRKGFYKEGKETVTINPELGGAGPTDLTYPQIAALPTDPAILLPQLRASLPEAGAQQSDAAAFSLIGDYLRVGPPPAVAGALYRAAGLISGVSIRDEAVDAIGRHGLALTYDDAVSDMHTEYVLDRGTSKYLGSNDSLIRSGPYGVAGQPLGADALLQVAVVDRIGERP